MDSQVVALPPFHALSSAESLETIGTYGSVDTESRSSVLLSVVCPPTFVAVPQLRALESDFFTDELGRNLLLSQSRPSGSNEPTVMPSRSRSPSCLSIETVLPSFDVLLLPLSQLCELVDSHHSLQRAETISSEAYTERVGAVIHRFLIMEIRREGKKPIWLRLERTRSRSVGVVEFLRAGASTPANDVVCGDAVIHFAALLMIKIPRHN
jgi:hypothetical protein